MSTLGNLVIGTAPLHRVVLSGASGLVGSAIRQQVVARGAEVVRLVRDAAPRPGRVPWNPSASPAIPDRSALEGCGVAIHLSGASLADHKWTEAWKREMVSSRVDSTRALAIALASLERPPRVLLVASAVGIYGNRGDTVLDETSEPGSGFLADLCQKWEAATQPALDAGIRVVHLRFGVVLSAEGGALEKMLPIFRAGLGGKLGSGRQWMSWVSLEDAAAITLFAAETSSLSGPVNVTAPNPITNADFTRILARRLHRPALLAVPAFALRLAYGQMADEALLASTRVVSARLESAGFQFAHNTVTRALATF
ncbi:MAG TPA: TIGR01777 family oxidoreductase [Terracidiphilus sp.]|jgi:uncharacterized protein (TIGR01777 family)|nr:TIGR01777 family oxidoreductase [Terracidiphilus sp.]